MTEAVISSPPSHRVDSPAPEDTRIEALETAASAKKGVDPRNAKPEPIAEPAMGDFGKPFLEEYMPVHFILHAETRSERA